MSMPLHPDWLDIAVRLILTVLAGAVIGYNRSSRGHAAGLRTTILVALAASVAMIQANILLSIGGKTADSFGVMDLMRLPLGILTGVGFIGGGTILKRGDLVTGVTTAATIWVTTVIGLALGGGQLGLGITATILTVITLWVLKWLDMRIPREHRAVLAINADPDSSAAWRLAEFLGPKGYRARFRRQSRTDASHPIRFWFEISWSRTEVAGPPLDLLKLINEQYSIASFEIVTEDRY
jgi:putative Mg2+ transporter-C (MgtC) family protein